MKKKEILSLENIVFAYPNYSVFEGLSIQIHEGEWVAIVGANGSGKTTLAKILSGLIQVEKGTFKITDELVTTDNFVELRKKVGMVFQNPDDQFVGVTVRDDIAFGLENHQLSREIMQERIQEYATKVEIIDFLDREPHALSGGQKQRVAIASVLALEPQIMIFDESTSMLDPHARQEVMDVVQTLHIDDQKTILTITHDLEEALLADRMIVLHDGKIVADAPPLEIFSDETLDLTAYRLQLPFYIAVSKALKQAGKISKLYHTKEGLVSALCNR
ncbi:MAG: energy-coupling factor transporter ATPase [Culicoidibacterales bacterium]